MSLSHTVPATKVTEILRQRFPQYSFPDSEDSEAEHVIDNSWVSHWHWNHEEQVQCFDQRPTHEMNLYSNLENTT